MGALQQLESINQDWRERSFERIIGNSPALEAVLEQVERVAPTDSPCPWWYSHGAVSVGTRSRDADLHVADGNVSISGSIAVTGRICSRWPLMCSSSLE